MLASNESLTSLRQHSLPICLVHGVQDNKVPVLSADLAAESLAKTNALTYLRLEGYGHHLNDSHVRSVVFQWLDAILFGKELLDYIQIEASILTQEPSSEDWKTDISQYIVSRGDGKIKLGAEGKKDTEGNQSAAGSISAFKETKGGGKMEGGVKGELKQGPDGKTTGEIKVEGSLIW